MATAAELAQVFAAARGGGGGDVGERLVELCAAARAEYGELVGAEQALVAAIAEHAPEGDDLHAYLERCHAGELALAVAAAAGSAAAIERLERDHRAVIEAMCRRFASPVHPVDDLRQILRAHLFVAQEGERPRIAEYAGQGRLDSWLRITAVRTFVDLGRRKDRAREPPADGAALALPDPRDLSLEVIKAEYRAAVRDALRDAAELLPLDDRHVLHQHFVAGLSIDQLGVALGIHRATAARRVVRAREALVRDTRGLLAARLQLASDELDEVIGIVISRLEVSLQSLFAEPSGDGR